MPLWACTVPINCLKGMRYLGGVNHEWINWYKSGSRWYNYKALNTRFLLTISNAFSMSNDTCRPPCRLGGPADLTFCKAFWLFDNAQQQWEDNLWSPCWADRHIMEDTWWACRIYVGLSACTEFQLRSYWLDSGCWRQIGLRAWGLLGDFLGLGRRWIHPVVQCSESLRVIWARSY